MTKSATLITTPFTLGQLENKTNLLIITHKGGRHFKVDVHFGRYRTDVDMFDLVAEFHPAVDCDDSVAVAQREALLGAWRKVGVDITMQLTDDQLGPDATQRHRIYKMWFASEEDYKGIGTPYEQPAPHWKTGELDKETVEVP